MRKIPAVPWFMFTEAGLSAAYAGSFTIVGVYYVSEIGLSPLQLVLIGTVMELTAFLFEIPTGVIADTFSRRLSLIVGWFLHAGAFLLIGLSPSYETILVAAALTGLAFTFESGAYEAWITDEVGAENVGPVFVRGARWSYAGALLGIGALTGVAAWAGLAAAIVTGSLVAVAIAASAIVLMPETGFRRAAPGERRGFRGLAGTAVSGVRLVRANSLVALILAVTFFTGMSTEAFDRLWEAHLLRDLGLPTIGSLEPVWWFALIRSAEMVLGLVATTLLLKRLQRFPAQSMARVLIVLVAVEFVAALTFGLVTGLAVAVAALLLYNLARQVGRPAYMTWLNQNIEDSSVRATVISFSGQIDAIGQAGGGPALGALGNAFGIRTALAASAAALLPALGLYARAVRRHEREPVVAAPEPGV